MKRYKHVEYKPLGGDVVFFGNALLDRGTVVLCVCSGVMAEDHAQLICDALNSYEPPNMKR